MTSATSSGTATAGPIARLRKPWLLLVALLSLGTASVTSAADYYFSSAGSDASRRWIDRETVAIGREIQSAYASSGRQRAVPRRRRI